MALVDYEKDLIRCEKCSHCKYVWPGALAKSWRFWDICPSISRYNFETYSAAGRMHAGLALLRGYIDYTDEFLDIIYKCQMCGACDITCKVDRDIEPFESLLELRAKAVEDGQLLPEHMMVIDGLKNEDNMLQKLKKDRGDWVQDLEVKDLTKERAEVCFHVGCRYSYDEELWHTIHAAVELLKRAGVDVGVFGKEENCCGGRAYEMGYQGEFVKYMESNIEAWKTAGANTVVTACSDCYAAFKATYSRYGNHVEVFHITEYLEKLIKEGKLKLTKKVPMTVTYHDPCHLGRLSERYLYSSPGKPYITEETKVLNQMYIYDPPKQWRRGEDGVYEPPRNILRDIPGLDFIEMERIRGLSWCCGSGGGAKEAYPEFALWTANERLDEADSTGAEALVTACPWCVRNFKDALNDTGRRMEIYDIVDIVQRAI